MRDDSGIRATRAIALSALLVVASARPAAAQWEIGLGLNFADTRTNALGLGGTVTWSPAIWVLRGFLDAERGVPDLKQGLRYDEPDRVFIVDQQGVRQNPRGDELWQGQGWNVHTAGYATLKVWRISAGPGVAYNGHDGSVTSGLAILLVGDITRRSEIDLEFLRGGSWRLRIAIGFWQF